MVGLKELVTGGKDLQQAIWFDTFPELLTSFYADDPVKAAIQHAYGQLALTDDVSDGREARTKLPKAGPAEVKVVSYPGVVDVGGDELIYTWIHQLQGIACPEKKEKPAGMEHGISK